MKITDGNKIILLFNVVLIVGGFLLILRFLSFFNSNDYRGLKNEVNFLQLKATQLTQDIEDLQEENKNLYTVSKIELLKEIEKDIIENAKDKEQEDSDAIIKLLSD